MANPGTDGIDLKKRIRLAFASRDAQYNDNRDRYQKQCDSLQCKITAREEKVAVLAMRPPLQTQRHMTWINAGKRPDIYAHNLYNNLRTLDRAGCVRIFVQSLPPDERWAAILDRLQRASGMGDGSLELSVS